ncbi:MAG: hypothetical protein J6Q07_04020 [Alistipes sp.]|nr:hypothetical protein [Alistipes sp.]
MISYKRLPVLIVLLLFSYTTFGQTTNYYKQIKVVKNNQTIASGKGGQFISFFADICYDSNSKGVTVNNGQLDRVSKSGDVYTKYKGKSYWGEVTYQFTNDLQKLAVIKSDGTIYVYQRATPPAGVTTSSLIKSKSSGGGTAVGYAQPQTYYPPTNYGSGNSSTTNSSQNITQQSTNTQYQKSRHKCHYCNGTGDKIIDPSRNVPQFGLSDDVKEYCSKCGQYFKKGTHAHITCGHCGGRGYNEY